jgi:Zn-dependent M28 family amino/carboxypeptidase
MRRVTGASTLLIALIFTFTLVSAAPPSAGGYGNASSVTADELSTYLHFLASDQLEGRNTPSRGYDTASLYIASHLREWGVKPLGSTTGTKGPLQAYFMPIELVSTQMSPAGMKLSLTAPFVAGRGGFGASAVAGPRNFEYGAEWVLGGGAFGGFGGGRGGGAPTDPIDIASAQLVFVGNGYVITKTNTDPYKDLDVKGKIMIVAGLPAELAAQQAAGRGGGRGGAAPNPLGVENTDFVTPQGHAAKHGALGIIMIPNFQQLSTMAAPAAGRGAGPNGPAFQVVRFQAGRPASVPTITAGVALTNALFQGEKLTGSQVFEGAAAGTKLESFALNAEKKVAVQTAVTRTPGSTQNVIGMVEGRDPVLKGEFVVISAHLDHVGFSAAAAGSDNINNGADDDGSGSAALMAVARAYAQGAAKGIRPRRSVIFLWVTGEEKGLWGSQYFAQFPPVDITKVVANLNMDMVGRSKPPGYTDPPSYKLVEPGEVLVVGPRVSSDDMGAIVGRVAADLGKLKINDFYDTTAPDATHDNLGPQPNGQRIFYRSDHYNFAKMGIPVAFYTTGIHTDYHRVSDSPDKIDYPHMEAITRSVAGAAWVIGNAANRPKLNAKLPELLVNDMKAAKDAGWGALTPVAPPLPGTPF